jgi:probable HAF family extracellular repeat protein
MFSLTVAGPAALADPMTDLNSILGSGASRAFGINSSGAIVGDMTTGVSTDAFLLANGKVTDLSSLLPAGSPWQLLTATGINDLGQIIGFGVDNGNYATFLLIPSALGDAPNPPALVPEPSSVLSFTAMLAFGFACLPAMRRRAILSAQSGSHVAPEGESSASRP